MYEKQAIEILNKMNSDLAKCYANTISQRNALSMAVAALEKQISKKPELEAEDNLECPTCGSFVGFQSECKEECYQSNYCSCCGQRLEW